MSMNALLQRIRAEFKEMPGLKVTEQQASRLWSSDEATCQAALRALELQGFLWRTPTGAFVALPRPGGRSAKAAAEDVRPTRCPHCHHLNAVHVERTAAGSPISASFRCSACSRVVTITESA